MSLYFLAFIPPEIIKQEVTILKEEICLKYAAKHALKLPAHITLQAPFKINEEDKVTLLEVLTRFAEKERPLEINLSGFGSFPPRVIFIDVQNKQPIIEFHDRLQRALSKISNLQGAEYRKLHPHVTLATRDLKEENFQVAWNDFKDRKYSATFQANSIYLLRHNGKAWKVNSEFILGILIILNII
jgi:2'-5' RNA ligase